MKHHFAQLTGLLALTLSLAATPGAFAAGLDDHLQLRCGVDAELAPDQVLNTYRTEIVSRAAGFQILADTPDNLILLWYLGQLPDAEARALSARVLTSGRLEFRHAILGAISARPDWTGLQLAATALDDVDGGLRESAATVLLDVDYTAPGLDTADHRVQRVALANHIAAHLPSNLASDTQGRLTALVTNLR